MPEPLAIYLNDHMGGAQVALHLLQGMREQHDDEYFRRFAENLLPEIDADDRTLGEVVHSIGSEPSMTKKAAGWLTEKATRLKLGHTKDTSMEMFESLEMLMLGIVGKRSMWAALKAASPQDARLAKFDFEHLISRAQKQIEIVDQERLRLASFVLRPETAAPKS